MSLRIGLLGAGRIGKVHAGAVGATVGATLVAVADAIPAAAKAVAGPAGARIATIESIIAADDIDAVLITTPTDMHADLIEQAARAGKKIFCEKPIDLDVARVRKTLKTVEREGALLMVGFNRRFDPNFAEMKRQIEAGAVGKVEMVQITSRDPGPPPYDYIKRSGGMFRDMTIHDFDMARFLLGEEPVSVSATASVLVDKQIGKLGDIDSAAVVLRTASGRMAMISNSRRATYGYDQRVEVHGSNGLVSAENLRETNVEVAGADGYKREPLMNFFMTRYTAAYAAEIAAFVKAATAKGKPKVSPSGTDGLRALVLAEAAMKSAASGRTVSVAI
jgi:myo-inositol 2-dehydrogenase / D-chiro-inositol 1-dehydrogenase